MEHRIAISTAAATAALAISLLAVAPAFAREESQPTRVAPVSCALERIGTQFVRCDDLSGAGSRAQDWVPEQK